MEELQEKMTVAPKPAGRARSPGLTAALREPGPRSAPRCESAWRAWRRPSLGRGRPCPRLRTTHGRAHIARVGVARLWVGRERSEAWCGDGMMAWWQSSELILDGMGWRGEGWVCTLCGHGTHRVRQAEHPTDGRQGQSRRAGRAPPRPRQLGRPTALPRGSSRPSRRRSGGQGA